MASVRSYSLLMAIGLLIFNSFDAIDAVRDARVQAWDLMYAQPASGFSWQVVVGEAAARVTKVVDAPERKKSQQPIGDKMSFCSDMEKVTIFCGPIEEEPQDDVDATKAPNVTDKSDSAAGGIDDKADTTDVVDAKKAAADPAGDLATGVVVTKAADDQVDAAKATDATDKSDGVGGRIDDEADRVVLVATIKAAADPAGDLATGVVVRKAADDQADAAKATNAAKATDAAKAVDAIDYGIDVDDTFFHHLAKCGAEMRVLILDEPTKTLLNKLELTGAAATRITQLNALRLKITAKWIGLDEVVELLRHIDHVTNLFVEVLPADRASAYRKLHKIKNCDNMHIVYGSAHSIIIDFKADSVTITDASIVAVAQRHESINMIGPDFSALPLDPVFMRMLDKFDKVIARSANFVLMQWLTSKERPELVLSYVQDGTTAATYLEARNSVYIDLVRSQRLMYVIQGDVRSLNVYYGLIPYDVDMTQLLNRQTLQKFTMTETSAGNTGKVVSRRTNAYHALLALLAQFDPAIHWPELRSFEAFVPYLVESSMPPYFVRLKSVKTFMQSMVVAQKADVREFILLRKLPRLFELKLLTSLVLNFEVDSRKFAYSVCVHLRELDLDGWSFEIVGTKIVGTKTPKKTVLVDPKMASLTPSCTLDLARNTVTDTTGKAITLSNLMAAGFDALDNFKSVKIIGPPATKFQKLSQACLDLIISHIERIETIILDGPSGDLLIIIGQFAKRTTNTKQLQLIDAASMRLHQGVPELRQLICSPADLLQFRRNVNVQQLTLTVADGGTFPLASIVAFIERNAELRHILCEFPANALAAAPPQDGKPTIGTIVEQLHSLSDESRAYEYFLVTDSSNLFGIDASAELLQTSSIDLIARHGYKFKHLRVFIQSREEESKFCDFMDAHADAPYIERLYINVRDVAAERLFKFEIKQIRPRLSIELYRIDKATHKIVPLDSIDNDNGSVKLDVKNNDKRMLFFIRDDTTSLLVHGDNIVYRLMHKLIFQISQFEKLRVLNIHNAALSRFVLEFVVRPELYFKQLKTIYLSSIRASELLAGWGGILPRKELDRLVIRDVRYEAERLTEYDLGPKWRVAYIANDEFSSTRRWKQFEESVETIDKTEWMHKHPLAYLAGRSRPAPLKFSAGNPPPPSPSTNK